jgi:hypothetical protein
LDRQSTMLDRQGETLRAQTETYIRIKELLSSLVARLIPPTSGS